jgi:adenylate kinase family enzyme
MTPREEHKLTERELQQYAIALFDVLGFSNLHKNLGTEKLYTIYEELIDNAIIEKTKDGIKFLGATREGIFVVGNLEIRYVYFSDTIILWTIYREEFFPFFVTICSEFIVDAIITGLPLRGAMTVGNAIMDRDKGIFLGEPIIEAARLEKAQNWIGLTFGTSFNTMNFHEAMINFTDIQINYVAQMKEGWESINSRIVLDWPAKMREQNKTELIKTRLMESMNLTDKKIYYQNTFAFLDHSEKNKNWHIEMKKQAIERHKQTKATANKK